MRFLGRAIDVLPVLFAGIKGIQLGVFFGWCYLDGERSRTPVTNASG